MSKFVPVDDRKLIFDPLKDKAQFDLLIERSINHSRALHALKLFESMRVKCVNSYHVATILR